MESRQDLISQTEESRAKEEKVRARAAKEARRAADPPGEAKEAKVREKGQEKQQEARETSQKNSEASRRSLRRGNSSAGVLTWNVAAIKQTPETGATEDFTRACDARALITEPSVVPGRQSRDYR